MKTSKPVTKRKKQVRSAASALRFNPLSVIITDVVAARDRLPTDPRLRLGWAVDLAGNVGVLPKDEVDKRKLIAEIYAFIGAAGLTVPVGYIVPYSVHGLLLNLWRKMIQAAVDREPVEIVPTRNIASHKMNPSWRPPQIGVFLIWSPRQNRFTEEIRFPGDYETAAAQALGKLLLDFGHLVKECPAPKLRGKPGELCETWFVASRPNKLYCSSACQSRATTARSRPATTKSNGKLKRAKKTGTKQMKK